MYVFQHANSQNTHYVQKNSVFLGYVKMGPFPSILKNGRRGPIFTYPKKHPFSAYSVYFENWHAEIHTLEHILRQFLSNFWP